MTRDDEISWVKHRLEDRGLYELAVDTARRFSVHVNDVLGRDRTSRVTAARHALWASVRALGFSYPEVGAIFGLDHTSVMYAVQKRRAATDRKLDEEEWRLP